MNLNEAEINFILSLIADDIGEINGFNHGPKCEDLTPPEKLELVEKLISK